MTEPNQAKSNREIRPAATVMLLRDGANGIEVFMVARRQGMAFGPGALVFPGGTLDEADHDSGLHGRCDGVEGLSGDDVAFRVCAIRETFEEAGVLLAREGGGEALLAGARNDVLSARYRDDLNAEKTTLVEIAAREDLRLACDRLTHFAHWITPPVAPRRYDTHFFLAPAAEAHIASHDDGESTESLWIAPSRVVAEAEAGERKVMFVTLVNLMKLAESATVSEAIAAARAATVVTIMPEVAHVDGGELFSIPRDAGYAVHEKLIPKTNF